MIPIMENIEKLIQIATIEHMYNMLEKIKNLHENNFSKFNCYNSNQNANSQPNEYDRPGEFKEQFCSTQNVDSNKFNGKNLFSNPNQNMESMEYIAFNNSLSNPYSQLEYFNKEIYNLKIEILELNKQIIRINEENILLKRRDDYFQNELDNLRTIFNSGKFLSEQIIEKPILTNNLGQTENQENKLAQDEAHIKLKIEEKKNDNILDNFNTTNQFKEFNEKSEMVKGLDISLEKNDIHNVYNAKTKIDNKYIGKDNFVNIKSNLLNTEFSYNLQMEEKGKDEPEVEMELEVEKEEEIEAEEEVEEEVEEEEEEEEVEEAEVEKEKEIELEEEDKEESEVELEEEDKEESEVGMEEEEKEESEVELEEEEKEESEVELEEEVEEEVEEEEEVDSEEEVGTDDEIETKKESETKKVEEEEEEVFEIEIDDITYFATDEENGILYEMTSDGDVGKKIGIIKDGEPIFH